MRDGIRLYTVYTPVNAKQPVPILMNRTPYGSGSPYADDTTLVLLHFSYLQHG